MHVSFQYFYLEGKTVYTIASGRNDGECEALLYDNIVWKGELELANKLRKDDLNFCESIDSKDKFEK